MALYSQRNVLIPRQIASLPSCTPRPLGSSWSVQGEGSSRSFQAWQLAGAWSVLAEWKNAGGAGGQEMEEMKQKVEDG